MAAIQWFIWKTVHLFGRKDIDDQEGNPQQSGYFVTVHDPCGSHFTKRKVLHDRELITDFSNLIP